MSMSRSASGSINNADFAVDRRDLIALAELLQSEPPVTPVRSDEAYMLGKPWPLPTSTALLKKSKESICLDTFCEKYRQERKFWQHVNSKFFQQVLVALVKGRLANTQWMDSAAPDSCFRIINCLRVLLRDKNMQKKFHKHSGIALLAVYLGRATECYLLYDSSTDGGVLEVLREIANVFQKLCTTAELREALMQHSVHRYFVQLLFSSDIFVLHCSLYALISLAQTRESRTQISELHYIEILLRILQEYDMMSKKLSASLLRLLLADTQTKEELRVHDGIPVLLSLLHSDNVKLLWHVMWSLVQLAEHPLACDDIRTMGGIPLILSLLQERMFASERATTANGDASQLSSSAGQNEDAEEHMQHVLSLKSTCCACITELALNDSNAHQIVANNGIYIVALLILPQESALPKFREACDTLQRNAFRALRFLFSMERNRRLFKNVFPATLYEAFIDVGHYVRELGAYRVVTDRLAEFSSSVLDEIRENIGTLNQNREPTHFIRDFAVLEVLGSGAFGTVYKVRRQGAALSTCYAMKEISALHSALGRTAKEKEKSMGDIMAELTIAREQLRHTNIVRYMRTFVDQDRLYIVMDLIEGASLMEHFNSLKEKGMKFSEERLWHIFVQIVLALRYLHKDRNIVHRDLSPNNIMLGEKDKVTLTDFGLAKQKRADRSKMTTMVGTLQYCCPEILKSEPYGEKADVWAIGCVLYQMATLNSPFNAANLMILTTKIVEGRYEAINDAFYSRKVSEVVALCLTTIPDERPDIVEIASHLADIILRYLDTVRIEQIATERRLERERRRFQLQTTQNAQRNIENDQERFDSLMNLGSSDGGASLKDGAAVDEDNCACNSRPNSGTTNTTCAGAAEINVVRRRRESSSSRQPPQSQQGRSWSDEEDELISRINLAGSDSGLPPVPPRAGTISNSQRHSNSSPTQRNMTKSGTVGTRPNSGGGTVTISQRKVRQISDPMLPMLSLLHKLVYITQLPPVLSPNPRRRIVERYKRSLFSGHVPPLLFKEELRKLLTGSSDTIEFLNASDTVLLVRQASLEQAAIALKADRIVSNEFDPDAHDIGISYEQMLVMIESVLHESNYYSEQLKQGRLTSIAPLRIDPSHVPPFGHARSLSAGSLQSSFGNPHS